MPQSLSFMLEHLIFSTKDRREILTKSIQGELHPYMATLVRDLKCQAFLVGGVKDHVHLAIGLARTVAMADLVEHVKVESSKWVKRKGVGILPGSGDTACSQLARGIWMHYSGTSATRKSIIKERVFKMSIVVF